MVLPYIEEFGSDWGSNDYYWMETTEDNCLSLVVNSAWSDGMVIYSYDNGETWERKVFYHHPDVKPLLKYNGLPISPLDFCPMECQR